jgi:hypothetical protein
MFLLANGIRLPRPISKLPVEILKRFEPERVQMIARREGLDAQEARMLHAPREHEVTDEIALANADRGERHPHLEGDPRLLREDLHVTDFSDQRNQRIEQLPDFWTLSLKVLIDAVPSAGVRLVAIRELPPARGTAPERWRRGFLVLGHVQIRFTRRILNDLLEHQWLPVTQCWPWPAEARFRESENGLRSDSRYARPARRVRMRVGDTCQAH